MIKVRTTNLRYLTCCLGPDMDEDEIIFFKNKMKKSLADLKIKDK